MVTIDYLSLLKGVSDLCGLDRDNIQRDDEQIIRANLHRRLGIIWDAWNWPETTYYQRRYYRPVYSASEALTGATLTAVTERFFPQTGKCYQALRAMPLAVTSITRVGTTATVTTTSPHLLSTNDQVTISGATEPPYNITATITSTGASTFTYVMESDPGGSATGTPKVGVNPANTQDATQNRYWAVCAEEYAAQDFVRTQPYVVGNQVYYPPTNRSYQCYTDAAAGFLPTNTTYFAPLTDFDPYVALEQTNETKIGDVTGVWDKSPLVWRDALKLDYVLTTNGIRVVSTADVVWIEFKLKTPSLTGDEFSTTATYVANLDQAYYRSTANPATFPGNMYDCITTTSAGDSPESAAAKWSIVNIPRIFQRYLERGAYADYLVSDGQSEKAMIEDGKAKAMLDELQYRVAATQNQTRRNIVLTR